MALWSSGCLVLWSSGCLVLWSCGPVVLWSCGPLVLWSSGPVVLWSSGPAVLWSCVRVVLWSSGPKNVYELRANHVACFANAFGGRSASPQPPSSQVQVECFNFFSRVLIFFFQGLVGVKPLNLFSRGCKIFFQALPPHIISTLVHFQPKDRAMQLHQIPQRFSQNVRLCHVLNRTSKQTLKHTCKNIFMRLNFNMFSTGSREKFPQIVPS